MSNLTLDQKLNYIGVQISIPQKVIFPNHQWIDIENTLHEATMEVAQDSRLFSLLCSWVSVHGDYVIIEKLMKLQKKKNSPWLSALAVFALNMGFHQWKSLIKKQQGPLALVSTDLALSSISIKGEEPNFKRNGFLVPKGMIRIRSLDTQTPERLVKKNLQYRNRLLFGASWRADIVTAIEMGMKTPYQIAKTLGCSYEPAHRIFKEYSLATA
ncbi:MAG: hypothetical protein IPK04_17205 [Bdellovibrionales bacterium]|nr:hypothetical protein [Bdellovibrionales bacterium]